MTDAKTAKPMPPPGDPCPVTGATDWRFVHRFMERPAGETDFGFAPYLREIWQSAATGHVINHHRFDMSRLYEGDYWNCTYGEAGIAATYDKIMNLPAGRSDNRARAAVVDGFARARRNGAAGRLLDVGAGLAVFPAVMREKGWQATALDPDPRAAEHARTTAGVEGVALDFMREVPERRFDLVSFNKVLEHVPDPAAMLARAQQLLTAEGLVYLELPDAEAALAISPTRQEFNVDHYCAFSMVSFAMLAVRAGFRVEELARLIEPSGKCTLRGFLVPAQAG